MEIVAGEAVQAPGTALNPGPGSGSRASDSSHLLEQFDRYLRSAYGKGTYRNCRLGLNRYMDYLSLNDGSISAETVGEFLKSQVMASAPASQWRQTKVILGKLADAHDGRIDLVALAEQSVRQRAEFEQKMNKAKENEALANEQRGHKESSMQMDAQTQVRTQSPGGNGGAGAATYLPEGVPVEGDLDLGEIEASTPPENGNGEPVDPAAVQFKPSSSQPRVSHRPNLPEMKRALNEEPRIKIYAVDENGNQDEAGKYTVKEIKFAGGEAEFVRKFVQPRYPHCTEYRIVTIDAKDGEKLQGKVNVGRKQPVGNAIGSFKETVETIRSEQDRAANTERARLIEAEERQQRLLKTMKDFLGDSGGGSGPGGNASLARDMIAMEMVKDVISSVRGSGRNEGQYVENLIRKLEESKASTPQERPKTIIEQMMEYRLMKQMMDETFPQSTYLPAPGHMGPGGMSFGGFDGMGLPPMPALPPTTSPMQEVEKALAVVQKFAPPAAPPVTYEGMLGMMNQVATLVRPAQGALDPNIVAMLRKMEDLERRIDATANKPPSFMEQMQGFAAAISAIQSMGQKLNPPAPSGGRASDMGMLEFIDSMSDKVPRIIDSVVMAKAKAAGFAGTDAEDDDDSDNSGQEQEQETKPAPKASGSARRKQARVWAKFGEMIENSTTEDETGNALIFLINGIKDDPKWIRLFKGIATLAIQRKRMQLRKVIATILNTMYKNSPPEGAIDRIVTVIVKNRTMFAKFVGMDPDKVKTATSPSPAPTAPAPAQPARAPAGKSAPAPAPKRDVVPDMRTPAQVATSRAPQAPAGRTQLRVVQAPVAQGVVTASVQGEQSTDDEYPEVPVNGELEQADDIDPENASIIEGEASVLDGSAADPADGEDDQDTEDDADADADMVSADGDPDEFDDADDADADEASQ